MAARFEEQSPDALLLDCTQCENCGATEGLLRCSRCHAAWFCSLHCHKSYWPFHKAACRPNQFADAVEQQEPKFAAWMRAHGKLAVLQDEEVDRLERANKPGGYLGLSRPEVMEAMYGRMDPSPAAPSYDTTNNNFNNNSHHQQQQPAGALQPTTAASTPVPSASAPSTATDRAWQSITIPADLGLAATRHKWRQSLTHVEVFVRLPDTVSAKQVRVQLEPRSLCVSAAGDELLSGRLSAEVKVEDSIWFIDDGIVHIQLLKRNRKGNYANGCTAADTFWFGLFAGASGVDRLSLTHPPTRYYSMHTL